MLEAYDAGVPVISSDAVVCPALVEEHGGDLFPREDVPALIALLERHARERAPRRPVDLFAHPDRQRGVWGTSVYVRVHLGGCRNPTQTRTRRRSLPGDRYPATKP